MNTSRTRIVVVISDTHCGSRFGLLPPGVCDAEGAEYRLNKFQEWLWQCWSDCTGRWLNGIVGKDAFDLVINGDAIEGVHHGTTEVIDSDPSYHSVVAGELLRPLADRAEHCWMVAGTEAHTRTSEAHLGKAVGATMNTATRSYCWPSLTLKYAGQRVNFNHHISSSLRPWTQASGLGIALESERAECARARHDPPDIVVRAHRHIYGCYRDTRGMIVVTPCWQGPTRFVRKVKPDAIPSVGMVILDWRKADEADFPQVHTKVYHPPQPKAANA